MCIYTCSLSLKHIHVIFNSRWDKSIKSASMRIQIETYKLGQLLLLLLFLFSVVVVVHCGRNEKI